METTKPQPTPGYNSRLEIFFQTDKRGRKCAYYVSRSHYMRAFRMGLAEAELAIAQNQADLLPGHPWPRQK